MIPYLLILFIMMHLQAPSFMFILWLLGITIYMLK